MDVGSVDNDNDSAVDVSMDINDTMAGAFRALTTNARTIEQYVTHLEEIALGVMTRTELNARLAHLRVRDRVRASRGVVNVQRPASESSDDSSGLFMSDYSVSTKKRGSESSHSSPSKRSRKNSMATSNPGCDALLDQSPRSRQSRSISRETSRVEVMSLASVSQQQQQQSMGQQQPRPQAQKRAKPVRRQTSSALLPNTRPSSNYLSGVRPVRSRSFSSTPAAQYNLGNSLLQSAPDSKKLSSSHRSLGVL